ncbi:MAG: thiamine-phosphate kinase [Candidatus Omnitrophota bacterium]|jgi:thiamine-monophosphate kinase
MNEFSFIEYLRKKIPGTGGVCVGIGDDAAVMSVDKSKKLVVSTDVIVENVDFKVKSLSPEKIGRKALAVNLSDLAAMGASPAAFVISIGKPPYITTPWLKRFYKGLLALAKQFNVACIGGDFSSSREFFASIAIFGEASPHQIVKRSGARPGDWIAVTGALGGSLLRHHHDFKPRVREGLFLVKHIKPTAMIDISDGLVQDLSHILKASGAGAVLDLDKIPVSRDARKISRGSDEKALTSALSDGEDFELLFTVSFRQKRILEKIWKKEFPEVSLRWIGKIEGKSPRISWRRNGKAVTEPRLSQKGFSHF